MSVSIPLTATTDAYKDWGLGSPYSFGSLTIGNNPVTLILLHGDPALASQTLYDYLTPRDVPLLGTDSDPICGFRIKSAIAGSPAQYSGYLTSPNQAGLGGGQAFTQTIAASGAVTNPSTSNVITGQVAANGGIAAGTGFSVVRNAAGQYTVTFTSAFAAPPDVVATVIDINGGQAYLNSAPLAGSVQIFTNAAAGGANIDRGFNFTATPMQ